MQFRIYGVATSISERKREPIGSMVYMRLCVHVVRHSSSADSPWPVQACESAISSHGCELPYFTWH